VLGRARCGRWKNRGKYSRRRTSVLERIKPGRRCRPSLKSTEIHDDDLRVGQLTSLEQLDLSTRSHRHRHAHLAGLKICGTTSGTKITDAMQTTANSKLEDLLIGSDEGGDAG
jgi:hypothetical protein